MSLQDCKIPGDPSHMASLMAHPSCSLAILWSPRPFLPQDICSGFSSAKHTLFPCQVSDQMSPLHRCLPDPPSEGLPPSSPLLPFVCSLLFMALTTLQCNSLFYVSAYVVSLLLGLSSSPLFPRCPVDARHLCSQRPINNFLYRDVNSRSEGRVIRPQPGTETRAQEPSRASAVARVSASLSPNVLFPAHKWEGALGDGHPSQLYPYLPLPCCTLGGNRRGTQSAG